MYYDIISGQLTTVDREITMRCIALLNQADPDMLQFMQYNINQCNASKGETYRLAKEFGQKLIDNTREVIRKPPMYKDGALHLLLIFYMFIINFLFEVTFPTAPHTEATEKGEIKYSEVVCKNVCKLKAYVEEMASGDTVSGAVNIQKVQDDILKLWSVVKALPKISSDQKNCIKSLYEGVVCSLNNLDSNPRSTSCSRHSSSQFLRTQVTGVTVVTSLSSDKIPLLHLKRKVSNTWEYSSNLTGVYLNILHEIATSGTTFKGLLSSGAHVVIMTSSCSRSKTVEYYQSIFQSFGSCVSALIVVPFNQASKQDVEALVDYIYSNLGMDLDYILPFVGIIPENG